MVCLECYIVPIALSLLMWLWGILAPYLGISKEKKQQIADKLAPKCPVNISGLEKGKLPAGHPETAAASADEAKKEK